MPPSEKYSGSAPYGYQLIENALIPVENESNIRAEIFDIFIDCQRLKTTSDRLNEKGYRTRSNSQFTDTSILRLLIDPIVLGIENKTPAIVSKETFDTVQKILSTQESTARLPIHIFSGIVYCGNCDTKMRVFSSLSKKYTCPDCRRKIDKKDLEKIYQSQLKDYALSSSKFSKQTSQIDSISERWGALSDEAKIQFIKSSTDRITVLGKEVEITFYSLSSNINGDTLATHRSQVIEPKTPEQQIENHTTLAPADDPQDRHVTTLKKTTKKERRVPIAKTAIEELFGKIKQPRTLQIGDGEVNLIFQKCKELEKGKLKKDQVFNIAFSTFLRTQGYWSYIKECLPFVVEEVAPRNRK